MSNYLVVRYPNKEDLDVDVCYLCGNRLGLEITPDHIIPNHLFDKEDPHKPTLPVHPLCNNLKSKEDQWFVKHIQLRSALNPVAEAEFADMMDKAIREKPDAYIVGKKLRNYKLAKTIFDGAMWGLELRHAGQSLLQLKIPPQDVSRFEQYVATMCQGLFIRNVPFAKPAIPELIIRQYANLELRGKEEGFMSSIRSFVDASRDTKFGQMWGNKISYIGSRVVETPDKGYVFVQFYSEIGILAVFK